jgi:long-chain acyl-CoA synthetase
MDIIAQHAAATPDAVVLIDGERRWTWSELLDRRNRLADSLARLGIARGENVVIYSHNSLEFVLAAAGIRAVGAVPVPMNHRLVAEEVAYVLDHSDATAMFVDDSFLARVEQVRRQATKVRRWIVMGAERPAWAESLEDLIAAGRPVTPPDDPSGGLGGSMIYTGGTTGRPKGALRGVMDFRVSLALMGALDLAVPGHVHLVAGPMYHSAPFSFSYFTQVLGGTVVILKRFDPAAALALIAEHRVTSTFMAPTLVQRILDLPDDVKRRYDVSSMKVLVVAAAPCPMRVKEEALRYFGPVFYEFYGSTELGLNTVLRPEDVLRKPGSCGRAAPGIEIALLDDDGHPVPVGQPGELCVRRFEGMFDGYYKDPRATKETTRGEWFTVGDVAWRDEDGFYYICDRKRDMIISGGVNIYPAEIEDSLHRHPAVEDVAVFGVPDQEWGERVHAAIKVRAGYALTMDEVRAFARQHMADFKIPREVTFHTEFPRDSAGKLIKRQLRDPYWAGRTTKV